ncbi:hypothetical protein [Virgibacillus sp. DJP39]|uniref:hypothetical protein n=1 Tax=Virgibacillus sp. DJP39 TaxID=3409790 RepID=UPI003BB54689
MSILTDKEREIFADSFNSLEEAKSFSKILYQGTVLQSASRLMRDETGIDYLFQFAHRFDGAGLFVDSSWENPLKLQPRLVEDTLKSDSPNTVMEILSELRMLAISKNIYKSPQLSSDDATHFLSKVMAQNIELLFDKKTKGKLVEGNNQLSKPYLLIQFLDNHMSLTTIFDSLLKEIERLTAQRPIMVDRIVDLIVAAKKRGQSKINSPGMEKLRRYDAAFTGPTNLSKQISSHSEYVQKLKTANMASKQKEAEQFGTSIKQTGIVCPYHADFLRHVNRLHPELIDSALALDKRGKTNFNEHLSLVREIIETSIYPATAQSIYGLAKFLERDIFSMPAVAPGLRNLIALQLDSTVSKTIKRDGVTANGVMVAGTVSVLGQPLGVGQGMNPTCQSARGISLWSQHDPCYLLELIAMAARDGNITIGLEGIPIHSRFLADGLATDLNKELDPVSLILVPHLDRIYGEMMKRVALHGEDGHKWVNPAFYGHMVLQGFRAVTSSLDLTVKDYTGFIRLFYATHHPEYNGGHELVYPSPVGIFMTNIHASFSGLHAVTIQRIKKDPLDQYRVYFYNPNNDSNQDWGQNIRCSIKGKGEEEGESSLPFHQFVSRIYAFHYNPLIQGQTQSVPMRTVKKIEILSRESWGENYLWSD